MEHPVDRSLTLVSRAEALRSGPGFYGPHVTALGSDVLGRIGLDPELLQESKLPNASLRFVLEGRPQVLDSAALRPAARWAVPFPAARRLVGRAVKGLARLPRSIVGARYGLVIDLEQAPNPDNRVRLSDRSDRFGRPRPVLHWRWREQDQVKREAIVATFARKLDRAQVGRIERRGDPTLDPNAHHHAGTTRMHPDPKEGVVDEHLGVHGFDNLFVAGSSVFPTAGFANPTLTAIALALRLVDHLSGGAQQRRVNGR